MTNNTKRWLHKLGAAAIGGGAGAVTSAFTSNLFAPDKFNLADVNGAFRMLGLMLANFIVNGILSAFFYLKQAPLPDAEAGAQSDADVPPFNPTILAMATAILTIGAVACVPRGTIAPGADPLVVQAEALYTQAPEVMHDFVSWEYRNRAVVSPDVTAAADLVREFGEHYTEQLKAATRAYKAARTPGHKIDVQAAINTLQGLLDDARSYYQKGSP